MATPPEYQFNLTRIILNWLVVLPTYESKELLTQQTKAFNQLSSPVCFSFK